MTEPVRPLSSKTQPKAQPTKLQETKNVKIGNVSFKKDQIEADKTKTYMLNGKKMNTVFVKPGVQIDFPDQKNPASVESIGLRSELYNYDDSHILIENLNGAKITGSQNRSDTISLRGNSSDNEIFVDQKESFYVNGNMRKDHVELQWGTSNNTVHMDEKDKTEILYNQTGIIMNGEEVQSEIGRLQVEGEGESNQEIQLKASLGKEKYEHHKHLQK